MQLVDHYLLFRNLLILQKLVDRCLRIHKDHNQQAMEVGKAIVGILTFAKSFMKNISQDIILDVRSIGGIYWTTVVVKVAPKSTFDSHEIDVTMRKGQSYGNIDHENFPHLRQRIDAFHHNKTRYDHQGRIGA
ncbi:hypothetical protein IEQ34_005052 [Dendrobium chrysotoxum]|uniref:Uncharacterized protein n=1 Tax=Dendrobium chrysotoxum TaxID=161865 RepID=A0AAV7HA05_DENCH|nr:hypothetical protein IEQ34_005052 [Dendrobium chrysotoxum]